MQVIQTGLQNVLLIVRCHDGKLPRGFAKQLEALKPGAALVLTENCDVEVVELPLHGEPIRISSGLSVQDGKFTMPGADLPNCCHDMVWHNEPSVDEMAHVVLSGPEHLIGDVVVDAREVS